MAIEFYSETGQRAIFSKDGRYRYVLARRWQTQMEARGTSLLFICLNPSTATVDVDDPTVRRLIRFAHDDLHSELVLCNLFAYRATDPKELRRVDDPIGPENDEHIRSWAERGAKIVLAWGAYGGYLGRDQAVIELLRDFDLYALGETKTGDPGHPLYMPASRRPQLWRERS